MLSRDSLFFQLKETQAFPNFTEKPQDPGNQNNHIVFYRRTNKKTPEQLKLWIVFDKYGNRKSDHRGHTYVFTKVNNFTLIPYS